MLGRTRRIRQWKPLRQHNAPRLIAKVKNLLSIMVYVHLTHTILNSRTYYGINGTKDGTKTPTIPHRMPNPHHHGGHEMTPHLGFLDRVVIGETPDYVLSPEDWDSLCDARFWLIMNTQPPPSRIGPLTTG